MAYIKQKMSLKAGVWIVFWGMGLIALALMPANSATSGAKGTVVYSPTSTLSVVADPDSNHIGYVRRWRAFVPASL